VRLTLERFHPMSSVHWNELNSPFWIMSMPEPRKVYLVKQELARRRIPWKSVVPPLWRLFWRCGLAVPPPMFVGFAGNFVMACICLSGLFLFSTYILPWWHPNSVVSALLSCGPMAVGIGFLDSVRTRSEANRLGVPRWRDY